MCEKTKKFLFISLLLLLLGVVGLTWVLFDRNEENQILQKQQEVLDAKLAKLNAILKGEFSISSLPDIIPDKGWKQELPKRQTRRTIRRFVFTASVIGLGEGGAVFTCWSLLWIARLLIAGFVNLKEFFVNLFRHRRPGKCSPVDKTSRKQGQTAPQLRLQAYEHERPKANSFVKSQPKTYRSPNETERIDVLFCDEKSLYPKEQSGFGNDDSNSNLKLFSELEQSIHKTILSGYLENSLRVENSLNTQAENLERQATEFKEMTQTVKQTTLEHSKPLNTALEKLTQQLSAIREYASCQQGRIEKLQDGYDWNIIRTFCLKVIRCIDNLQSRITHMSEQDIQIADLEEIRDELIFALESSGVEQFEPEVNSEYRGQEKFAEAIKEKEHSEDPDMKGRIAQIIKPSYRYIIDEQNTKVVRPARVKLFG